MKRAAEPESESVGVADAGVVLARLDRRDSAHAAAAALFERSAAGRVALYVSVVNLAEVFQHAQAYVRATGLDPVALLGAFNVVIHSPGVDVARQVARLGTLGALSLADRFAAATALVLDARLHTTDTVLAAALRRRRQPVTLL